MNVLTSFPMLVSNSTKFSHYLSVAGQWRSEPTRPFPFRARVATHWLVRDTVQYPAELLNEFPYQGPIDT